MSEATYDLNKAIAVACNINDNRKHIFCPRARCRCRTDCIEYTRAKAEPADIQRTPEHVEYAIKGGKCKHYGK